MRATLSPGDTLTRNVFNCDIAEVKHDYFCACLIRIITKMKVLVQHKILSSRIILSAKSTHTHPCTHTGTCTWIQYTQITTLPKRIIIRGLNFKGKQQCLRASGNMILLFMLLTVKTGNNGAILYHSLCSCHICTLSVRTNIHPLTMCKLGMILLWAVRKRVNNKQVSWCLMPSQLCHINIRVNIVNRPILTTCDTEQLTRSVK